MIGLVFAQAALQAIVDETFGPTSRPASTRSSTRQLVRRQTADGRRGREYRFGHLMIRDATYAGLLKRTRAHLHERFVAWADEVNRAADRATEFEEILGYHLEQAHRYLSELGPLDEHGVALGIDASGRLASAGQRAFVRGDMPATANLLRRAAACCPTATPPGRGCCSGQAWHSGRPASTRPPTPPRGRHRRRRRDWETRRSRRRPASSA